MKALKKYGLITQRKMISSSTKTNIDRLLTSLKIIHLEITFGKKVILHDLSLSIEKPDFVAIVGHNGSGKTSFLKAISQNILYKGDILVNDQDIRFYTRKEKAKLLSYLSQKNDIRFSMPVKELVVMGRQHTKSWFENYTEEDYREAKRALEAAGLASIWEEDYLTLSGGEQQMAWLAQAFLQNASLLLLDEPSQYLDVYHRKKFYQLVNKLPDSGKMVLCVTHDLDSLKDLKGSILNLSIPNPSLEKITPEVVEKNKNILEEIPKNKTQSSNMF